MSDLFAALGFVKRLIIEDSQTETEFTYSDQRSWTKPVSKHVGVMLAEDKEEILIVTWWPSPSKIPDSGSSVKKLLHEWSHWMPSKAWKLDFNRKGLKKIGTAIRIEYWSDKFALEGDKPGRFHLYQHEFKKNAVQVFANKSETVISIRHRRLWSERGIIA